MLKYYRIVRDAAKVVERAAIGAVDALNEGRIEQEPQFTDRMRGRIEQAMEGYAEKGVSWRAKTLTDRGAKSQESLYGADFFGVVSIELPGLFVNKGFLAQAKLIRPGKKMKPTEYERMKEQCDKMLQLSPDSFIFLYSNKEIRIVPAITILSCEPINPHDLYSRSIANFFENHFSCFIGDRKINCPSIEFLEAMADEYTTRNGLALFARYSD